MRAVNLEEPGINGNSNGNGVHLNGVARKRPAKPQPPAEPEPKLSGFEAVEVMAIDAEMWPVHAVMWLEPLLTVVAPVSSGLGMKRRHRVPAPDFLYFGMAAAGCAHSTERGYAPLAPNLGHSIPASDLAPLGWEPRAVCAPGGKESK